jgi:hypothetical protein
MYAFGNHLRMASVEHHLSSLDLKVATMFEQERCSHSNNRNPVVASLKYVERIEEILELDYVRFQTIVLFCN